MTNGRPPFTPSREQRHTVQVLAAHGIDHRLLAKTIGIDAKTLRKAFRAELSDGLEQVKASMIISVVNAGIGGDWHAARYWLSSHCEEWRVTERREVGHVGDGALGDVPTEQLEARLAELRAKRRPHAASEPPPTIDPTALH